MLAVALKRGIANFKKTLLKGELPPQWVKTMLSEQQELVDAQYAEVNIL